jgi:hypothetical protein
MEPKAELKEFSADPSGQVNEAIHAAAYHGNTLGKSILPLVLLISLVTDVKPFHVALGDCYIAHKREA